MTVRILPQGNQLLSSASLGSSRTAALGKLACLSDEILQLIWTLFSAEDLLVLEQTSAVFWALSRQEPLWQHLFLNVRFDL